MSAEHRTRLVRSLGLPPDAERIRQFVESSDDVSPRLLSLLVDRELVGEVWRRWYPEDAGRLASLPFAEALRRMLADAVAIGYGVDRFRLASRALPEPPADAAYWIEPFERAVAGRNAVDLRVHVSEAVARSFLASNDAAEAAERWDPMVSQMADGLFYELGIVLPRLELQIDDAAADTDLRITINDARLPPMRLMAADRVLVNDTVARLTLLSLEGEQAVNPANGSECATVPAEYAKLCEQAGLSVWTRMGYAILAISAAVRRFAGAFVGRFLTDFHTESLARAFPELVAQVRVTMEVHEVTQVLRALVEEEIGIRNLRQIFEVLVQREETMRVDMSHYIVFEHAAVRRALLLDASELGATAVERRLRRVRQDMKRYITYKHTRGGNTLVVYLIEPALEKRLAKAQPLNDADRNALIAMASTELGNLLPTEQAPVILTNAEVRLRLRRALAPAFPRLAVLSYQELSPDCNIRPIGRMEAPAMCEGWAWLVRSGRSDAGSAPPVDDPLVAALRERSEQVIGAARGRRGPLIDSLSGECFDVICSELAGVAAAGRLADALTARVTFPIEWAIPVEHVLDVALAAARSLAVPATDDAPAVAAYHRDLARLREASYGVARALAVAAVEAP